jgi:DNA-binding NarL/FixJ family response regulator
MNIHPKKQSVIIGVADDDNVFSHLLVNELCKNLKRKIAFCSNNGYDLIKYANIYNPDILVVDLYMPHVSGIEAIKFLKKNYSKAKIVAYSCIFQEDILSQLQNIPIEAYCKNNLADIDICVDYLEKGGTYFCEPYYTAWQNEDNKQFSSNTTSTEKLNATEIRIILQATDGKTNSEIANALHLSKRTIDTYIGNMLEKLNLSSKNDLIKFAFQNGICTISCSNASRNYCIHNSILQLGK